jgi:hypothetical protein
MIDRALAIGDKVGAEGALAVLKEINPSAAHSLECLGILTFNTRDPEGLFHFQKSRLIF